MELDYLRAITFDEKLYFGLAMWIYEIAIILYGETIGRRDFFRDKE